MKVSVKESKVMWCNSICRKGILVRFNGKLVEEVECFKCLGMDSAANSRMENELTHGPGEGLKVFGGLKNNAERKKC